MTETSEQPTKPERKKTSQGAIAQLGERLPCTQEVVGSIPSGSTIFRAVTCCFDKESSKEKGDFLLKVFLLFNNLEISDVLSGL